VSQTGSGTRSLLALSWNQEPLKLVAAIAKSGKPNDAIPSTIKICLFIQVVFFTD
jgi:hypothetical protein